MVFEEQQRRQWAGHLSRWWLLTLLAIPSILVMVWMSDPFVELLSGVIAVDAAFVGGFFYAERLRASGRQAFFPMFRRPD